mgnify:CR=1 FL=1
MANAFDSTNAPNGEPSEIVAGDFIQWKREDLTGDYPTSEYTLKYSARLNGTGTTEIEITGGTDHLVQVSSSTTANYAAGTYSWQAYITRNSDSERIVVAEGYWEVVANRDTSTDDPRTDDEVILDKINSLLLNKADSDVSSYSIAGRSLTKMSPDELLKWRDYFEQRVIKQRQKEDIKLGRKTSSTVKVRFSGWR